MTANKNESITCAEVAANTLRPAFPKRYFKTQECFVVLLLDVKHSPIGKPFVAGLGTIGQVQVHPRDVFREAIKRNAHALIVAHNHASGDVAPSSEDLALTKRLQSAATLLGVCLLDHIILSPNGKHISLAETGKLLDPSRTNI